MEPIWTLGALRVTPYSLMIFAGAVLGILLAARKKEARPALPLMLLLSLLFGHWFWCLFNINNTEEPVLQFVLFWQGGYTLYGAVFGGLLGAFIASRVLRRPMAEITDAAAPGAAAALLLGRLAEYFAGTGYGAIVEKESCCFFPLAFVTDQGEDYIEWSYAVWFWESAAALVILLLLLWIARRARRGEVTVWFLALLGTTQIFFEQWRNDDYVTTFNSFVRFSQVAALLTLAVLLVLLFRAHRPGGAAVCLSLTTFVLASLTVVCAEFSFDKPWFDLWMRVGLVAAPLSAAVLLRLTRGGSGVLPGVSLVLCGALFSLLHFLADWSEDTVMLYTAIAFSVFLLGVTLRENMASGRPETPCL